MSSPARTYGGSGSTTLAEVLRLAPNLHVGRIDAGTYTISARGFNSSVPNKLLVVEDDATVRRVAADSLRDLGYTVHHADGAAQVLRLLEQMPQVRLLFTDIVMPDGNGRKLAEDATAAHPELKVLFTTGYARDAIMHTGVLDEGVALLPKPYSIQQLASKVRDMLGQHTLH